MGKGTLWALNKLEISRAVIRREVDQNMGLCDAATLIGALKLNPDEVAEMTSLKREYYPLTPERKAGACVALSAVLKSYGARVITPSWPLEKAPCVIFLWGEKAKQAFFEKKLGAFKRMVANMDADLFMSESDQLEDVRQAITETWHDEAVVARDQYRYWDDALRLVAPNVWYIANPELEVDYY